MRSDLPTGTVTFLFTDVEGSTSLLNELGAEAYAEALAEHRRVIREACAARGGMEVDTQGDAFFFAFPTAPGALAAAGEMTQALASGPIRVRVGLHTGTPLVTDEGYVGGDVHRAARIAAVGHGGQVLVSASTAQLVELELSDLGEHRLKDLSAPERVFQLGDSEFPALKSLYRTNLPIPSTPFLGRERELREVVELLSEKDARLLTLTGPGGTGKTRLAAQAAGAVAERFPEGVFWVPLAALRDHELVLESASQVLGAKNGLASHIADNRMLLLLDNFEQVVEAARGVSALLGECPRLEVIVTSREPLHLAGEQEYPVPPFVAEEGVDFFAARARAVKPDFAVDEAVPEICRRLDELPLALELAASRVKALSTGQILSRLERRLPLLTGGNRDAPERQRTLTATIEWSYDLLSSDEQQLFARLSVFAGGCTLEAAEEVADADLDTLQSLVEKSLLRFSNERYWMLETIREYASDELQREDGPGFMQARHAEWFASWVERRLGELGGSPLEGDFTDVTDDHDNARHALRWAWATDRIDLGLRLGASLVRYWLIRGHFQDAIAWREEAGNCITRSEPARQLSALKATGVVATVVLGDPEAAQRDWEVALHVATSLGLQRDVLYLRTLLAGASSQRGDLKSAIAMHEENLSACRRLGDRYEEARSLHHLGETHRDAGEFDAAEEALVAAVSINREGAWSSALLHNLHSLGDLALDRRDFDSAGAFYRESLELSLSEGDERSVVYCLAGLASVLRGQGRPDEAASLWGAVANSEKTLGFRLAPHERRRYEAGLRELEGTSAWTQGTHLETAAAVALALESMD